MMFLLELRSQALGLLFAVATVTGSVHQMVKVANSMLSGSETLPNATNSFLDQLLALNTDITLSIPKQSASIDSFIANIPKSEGAKIFSFTCDGVYLYIWDGYQISKIGTGFHGSLQGQLISSTRFRSLENQEEGTATAGAQPAQIVVVDGKLFVHSPSLYPANAFAVFALDSLKFERLVHFVDSSSAASSELSETSSIEYNEGDFVHIISVVAGYSLSVISLWHEEEEITHMVSEAVKINIPSKKILIELPQLSAEGSQSGPKKIRIEIKSVKDEAVSPNLSFISNGRQLCRITSNDSSANLRLFSLSSDVVIESVTYQVSSTTVEATETFKTLWKSYLSDPEGVGEPFSATTFSDEENVDKWLLINLSVHGGESRSFKSTEISPAIWERLISFIVNALTSEIPSSMKGQVFTYSLENNELAISHEFELVLPKDAVTDSPRKPTTYFNGSKLIMQYESVGKVEDTMEAFCYVFDINDGAYLTSHRNLHYSKEGYPDHVCYDCRNNMIWSFDESSNRTRRWRNAGLPPPSVSFSRSKFDPVAMIKASPKDRLQYCMSNSQASLQSMMLFSLLENLSLPYSPPPPAAPAADSDASHSLEISIKVPQGTNDTDRSCLIYVKGQLSSITTPPPLSPLGQGFYVVTLDDDFNLFEERYFDSENVSGIDRFADYLDGLESGKTLMIGTCGSVTENLHSRVKTSLCSVGADNLDSLPANASLAIIGRKGASKGSASQSIIKPGKKAVLRQKIPLLVIPMKVEVTPKTISLLLETLFLSYERLLASKGSIDACIMLSTLRILSVNFYHLMRGCNLKNVADFISAEDSSRVKAVLSSIINSDSVDLIGWDLISSSALTLFVVSMSILYPETMERFDLLDNYSRSYMNSHGKMKSNEKYILELLVNQVGDVNQHNELLSSNSNLKVEDILENLMNVYVCELDLSLSTSRSSLLDSLAQAILSIWRLLFNGTVAFSGAKNTSGYDVISLLQKLLAFGENVLNVCLQRDVSTLNPDIDFYLSHSPIKTIVSTSFTAASLYLNNSPTAISSISEDRIASLVKSMSQFQVSISRLLKSVPKADIFIEDDVPLPSTKELVYESIHPYDCNQDVYTEVSIPGASNLTITFDQQSRTEQSCDYLTFLLPDRSATFHPAITSFSGRDGSENFPGYQGRPPLVIPGSRFIFYFHSDGSVQDWGYKFTVTSKLPYTGENQSCHWIEVLNRQLVTFSASLASVLLRGEDWNEEIETSDNISWFRTQVIKASAFAPITSQSSKNDEENFLRELTTRPEGSLAAKFVQVMKKQVLEDQGSIEAINRAVYSTCAAILKHNHLTAEALAIAKGTRVAEISPLLIKAWKSGQKMRNYFDLADMISSTSNTGNTKRRSLYAGSTEETVQKVSEEIVTLSRFLLLSADHEEEEVAKESDEGVSTPISSARKKWDLISKIDILRRQTSQSSDVHTDQREKWQNLVTEVVSSDQLNTVLAHRRRIAQRNESKNELTTTEKILKFLQSGVNVNELKEINRLRNNRAKRRILGLDILSLLLQVENPSPFVSEWTAASFYSSLSAAKSTEFSDSNARFHYMKGMEGCSSAEAMQLTHAYARYLTNTVTVISHQFKIFSNPETSTIEKAFWLKSITACLKSCALDFDVHDHFILSKSGLLSVLKKTLYSSNSELVAVSENLVEVLAGKNVHIHDEVNESTSTFSRELAELIRNRLENHTAAICQSKQFTPEADVVSSKSYLLSKDGIELKKHMLGFSCRHFPTTLNHAVSFYVYRPHSQVLDGNNTLVPGARVIRGPDWKADINDDGGLGNFGIVDDIYDDGTVGVTWELKSALQKYRYDTKENIYEVVLADESVGGLLFMKGAPGLVRKSKDNEDKDASWSYYGLQLLPDGHVCSFIASGGKTPHYTRSEFIAPEQWVHVSLQQSLLNHTISVNDKLTTVTLPDTLSKPGNYKPVKIIESPHPYLDSQDQYTIIQFDGAVKLTIRFDPMSATEANYDYVQFTSTESRSIIYGEKYSGGRGGSTKNFPGMEGRPPLVINSDRCEMYFHSDGSNNDWGYKIYITAELSSSSGSIDGSVELNPYPFYFGQVPGYAIDSSRSFNETNFYAQSASVFLKGVYLHDSKETPYTIPPLTISSDLIMSEFSILPTLTALSRGMKNDLNPVGKRVFSSPTVVGSLFQLMKIGNSLVKCAVLRVFTQILPVISLDIIDSNARRAGVIGDSFDSFLKYMIKDIGKRHNVWYTYASSSIDRGDVFAASLVEDTNSLLGVSMDEINLIYSLVKNNPEFRADLQFYVSSIIDNAGDLVSSISKYSDMTFSADEEKFMRVNVSQLDELYGLISLIGGGFSPLFIGSKAKYRGADGIDEECTILGFTSPPSFENTDTEKKTLWADCRHYGDAIKIALSSQPDVDFVVPATKVQSFGNVTSTGQPVQDNHSEFIDFVGNDLVNKLFNKLCRIDVNDRRPQYKDKILSTNPEVQVKKPAPRLPVIPNLCLLTHLKAHSMKSLRWIVSISRTIHPDVASYCAEIFKTALCPLPRRVSDDSNLVKPLVYESKHPYDNSMDEYTNIMVPNARQLIITFDPQSSTESGCDYVRFYKNSAHEETFPGAEMFSGGLNGSTGNWPGIGGCDPYVVPGNSFVLFFHSDGSVNSWGFKMFVTPEYDSVSSEPVLSPISQDPNVSFEHSAYIASLIHDGPKIVRPKSLDEVTGDFELGKPLVRTDFVALVDDSHLANEFESKSIDILKPFDIHRNQRVFPATIVPTTLVGETSTVYSEAFESSAVVTTFKSVEFSIIGLKAEASWCYVKVSQKVQPGAFVVMKAPDTFGWIQTRNNQGEWLFKLDGSATTDGESISYAPYASMNVLTDKIPKSNESSPRPEANKQMTDQGQGVVEEVIPALTGLSVSDAATEQAADLNDISVQVQEQEQPVETANGDTSNTEPEFPSAVTNDIDLIVNEDGELAAEENPNCSGLEEESDDDEAVGDQNSEVESIVIEVEGDGGSDEEPDDNETEASEVMIENLFEDISQSTSEEGSDEGSSDDNGGDDDDEDDVSVDDEVDGGSSRGQGVQLMDLSIHPMYHVESNPTLSPSTAQKATGAPSSPLSKAQLLQEEIYDIEHSIIDHDLVSCIGFAFESAASILAKWPSEVPLTTSVFGSVSNLLSFINLALKESSSTSKSVSSSGKTLTNVFAAALQTLKQRLLKSSLDDVLASSLKSFAMKNLSSHSTDYSASFDGSALTCQIIKKSIQTVHPHPVLHFNEDSFVWNIAIPTAKWLRIEFDAKSETSIADGNYVEVRDLENNLLYDQKIQGLASEAGRHWPGVNGVSAVRVNGSSCKIKLVSNPVSTGRHWGFEATIYGVIDEPDPESINALEVLAKNQAIQKKREASNSSKLPLSRWILEALLHSSNHDIVSEILSIQTFHLMAKLFDKYMHKVALDETDRSDVEEVIHILWAMLHMLVKQQNNYYTNQFVMQELKFLQKSIAELSTKLYDEETKFGNDMKKVSPLLQSMLQLLIFLDSLLDGSLLFSKRGIEAQALSLKEKASTQSCNFLVSSEILSSASNVFTISSDMRSVVFQESAKLITTSKIPIDLSQLRYEAMNYISFSINEVLNVGIGYELASKSNPSKIVSKVEYLNSKLYWNNEEVKDFVEVSFSSGDILSLAIHPKNYQIQVYRNFVLVMQLLASEKSTNSIPGPIFASPLIEQAKLSSIYLLASTKQASSIFIVGNIEVNIENSCESWLKSVATDESFLSQRHDLPGQSSLNAEKRKWIKSLKESVSIMQNSFFREIPSSILINTVSSSFSQRCHGKYLFSYSSSSLGAQGENLNQIEEYSVKQWMSASNSFEQIEVSNSFIHDGDVHRKAFRKSLRIDQAETLLISIGDISQGVSASELAAEASDNSYEIRVLNRNEEVMLIVNPSSSFGKDAAMRVDEMIKHLHNHVSSNHKHESIICIGDIVVRGSNWQYGLEDGGPGNLGKVIEILEPKDLVRVRWTDHGEAIYHWKDCLHICHRPADLQSQAYRRVSGDEIIIEIISSPNLLQKLSFNIHLVPEYSIFDIIHRPEVQPIMNYLQSVCASGSFALDNAIMKHINNLIVKKSSIFGSAPIEKLAKSSWSDLRPSEEDCLRLPILKSVGEQMISSDYPSEAASIDLSLSSSQADDATPTEQFPRWVGPFNNFKLTSAYADWMEIHEFTSLEEAQGAANELGYEVGITLRPSMYYALHHLAENAISTSSSAEKTWILLKESTMEILSQEEDWYGPYRGMTIDSENLSWYGLTQFTSLQDARAAGADLLGSSTFSGYAVCRLDDGIYVIRAYKHLDSSSSSNHEVYLYFPTFKCENGHATILSSYAQGGYVDGFTCNGCNGSYDAGNERWWCETCTFDMCVRCLPKPPSYDPNPRSQSPTKNFLLPKESTTISEARYANLLLLNQSISKTIPLIDLRYCDKPGTIANLFSHCRGLILENIKLDLWLNALNETAGGGSQFELKLSRSKARKFIASGKVDKEGRYTVFGQAFRAIHMLQPQLLRRSERIYTTVFVGEQAQDAGGPYRESFGIYMDELQSSALPLFIRSPNNRQATGTNREKWILNPDANTKTQLEMFCFVGKLMGIAIRSNEYLALNLPSIIW
jgi:hypothetical protein